METALKLPHRQPVAQHAVGAADRHGARRNRETVHELRQPVWIKKQRLRSQAPFNQKSAGV